MIYIYPSDSVILIRMYTYSAVSRIEYSEERRAGQPDILHFSTNIREKAKTDPQAEEKGGIFVPP